jgi:hypothetical protein
MAMDTEVNMTSDLDQKLYKYLFPVTEQKVFVEAEDKSIKHASHYKAIAREDNW